MALVSTRDDIAPLLPARQLFVVSHRGPIEFAAGADGRVVERGSGGLVTGFAGLGQRVEDAVWICAAISDEDRVVAAERAGSAFAGPDTNGWWVHMVDVEPERHRQFYGMIANPLLWFVQHGLWDLSDAPDIGPAEHAAWTDGYVCTNRQFADTVISHLGSADNAEVLVQDYHLYLVPEMVRAGAPGAFISFFCHIPWPHPGAWRVLPLAWRRAVFEGVLGADIAGFQTEADAANFVAGCAALLGAEVDYQRLEVRHQGRWVRARWYPISADCETFDALADSAAVLAHEALIVATRREKLIVRVDRTDLSKNILRGVRAFDLLLTRHPELRERVTFLALLQPSRQDVAEYARYLERIRHQVDELNARHGTPSWQPIDLRFVQDLDLAVAAYKQFDVLMVNPIADGMNLVAKEGVIVNRVDGVLMLSETAGAHAELGRLAVSVNPFDVDQQAEALWTALTMPADERAARLQACADVVRRNDLRRWLQVQLDDRAVR